MNKEKQLNYAQKYLLRVSCPTYNHAHYIEDALNGFCMQETRFPFVCTIIDDHSTDGTPEVINNYLEQHFDLNDETGYSHTETDDYIMTFAQHKTNRNCFFAVFCLKYNHHSINKQKTIYLDGLFDAKYVAICEGDDYWTSPHKLQSQVDILEANAYCTMVCNAIQLYSQKQRQLVREQRCYTNSQIINVQDVILKGGAFIPTCSIVYRSEILNKLPEYCKQCHISDWTWQIMLVMKGFAYYINELVGVYRTNNPSSWTGKQKNKSFSKRISEIRTEIVMLEGFANDYPSYEDMFLKKINNIIANTTPVKYLQWNDYHEFYNMFKIQIKNFDQENRALYRRNKSLLHAVFKKFSGIFCK